MTTWTVYLRQHKDLANNPSLFYVGMTSDFARRSAEHESNKVNEPFKHIKLSWALNHYGNDMEYVILEQQEFSDFFDGKNWCSTKERQWIVKLNAEDKGLNGTGAGGKQYRGAWLQIDKNGNIVNEFKSATDVERSTGVARRRISEFKFKQYKDIVGQHRYAYLDTNQNKVFSFCQKDRYEQLDKQLVLAAWAAYECKLKPQPKTLF